MAEANQQQQLDNDIRALGQELGKKLAASSLPLEVKQAWITLLPQMTWPQILRLFELLENEEAMKGEGFEELQQKLLMIKSKYDAKQKQSLNRTLDELETIEEQIKEK